MIRSLAKLLQVLNSETDPGQISLAFCFSLIAGLTPFVSLHNLLVIFLTLILRVNLSAFLLGLVFFSGMAYILDPLFHRIGLAALTASGLDGFWTGLYNSTFWRIEHFNNSIVMGSLIFSLILFIPLFFILNLLIRRYRMHVLAWVQKTRIMQAFKGSKLYNAYQSVSAWRGE